MSAEEWTDAEESRQWTFELLSKSKEMSCHHDTNPTHSLSHMNRVHAHTQRQRSIRVGYMSDPYT